MGQEGWGRMQRVWWQRKALGRCVAAACCVLRPGDRAEDASGAGCHKLDSPDALPCGDRHVGVGGGSHRSSHSIRRNLIVVTRGKRDHAGNGREPPAGRQIRRHQREADLGPEECIMGAHACRSKGQCAAAAPEHRCACPPGHPVIETVGCIPALRRRAVTGHLRRGKRQAVG